ncbi:hypothetical protein DNL40_02550 [Xylanimonas oleitrophica]|uniref:Uncharacterized protein n=1 Tax=Xylanimonas oleitrophica TaxID=2607479 RepID=A0A2W5WVS2_9MICO|nr:hypothetical protein [Xylanimonas oleitrophica]PZR55270.1 hypothetical protein DNL40_02550 [Xylanimonas oleitrophica]
MKHLPETQYDGARARWAHRHDALAEAERTGGIVQITGPRSAGIAGEVDALSPAAIPTTGRHETLFTRPDAATVLGPQAVPGNSLVQLDAHEDAVRAVLDATAALARDLREMDRTGAVTLDTWPAARSLIAAHDRLAEVQS